MSSSAKVKLSVLLVWTALFLSPRTRVSVCDLLFLSPPNQEELCVKTPTADDRKCLFLKTTCNKSAIQVLWNKKGSMIKSGDNFHCYAAPITYSCTTQKTCHVASRAEQPPHLFHPAHVVARPSLCHCGVCAVVAGAADGADVSVNALHVCRDAAFLNPPTHCLLRHTVCLLLSDGLRLPAKVKCCWLSVKRKLVYGCWSYKHDMLRERLRHGLTVSNYCKISNTVHKKSSVWLMQLFIIFCVSFTLHFCKDSVLSSKRTYFYERNTFTWDE